MLNCHTQVDYVKHRLDLSQELVDRPKDVECLRKYLDKPESIACYKILGVRGTLGTVASSNTEAGHASNEHTVPTKLLGILAIEKQILKLLEQEDGWIQHDITEHQELELHRLSKKEDFEPNSSLSKAVFSLTHWSFHKFEKNQKASLYYKKIPFHKGDQFVGNNIIHKDGDPSISIFIPRGGRYPLLECIAMERQCCHEIANDDGEFILDKWSTRYWCDVTYRSRYGDYGFHIIPNSHQDEIADNSSSNDVCHDTAGMFGGGGGGVMASGENNDEHKEGEADEYKEDNLTESSTCCHYTTSLQLHFNH